MRAAVADDRARPGEIKAALYQLWLMTRHERLADDDRHAKLTVYAKGLALYDRDAVMLALSDFAQSETFFPAWAELVRRIETHMGQIGVMLTALRIAHQKRQSA